MSLIKICGVKTLPEAMAAMRAGADMIGFAFVQKSPRYIAPEAASDLVTEVKQSCYEEGLAPPQFVGLFVDAGEKLLSEVAPFLGWFQFHGHEDAERISDLAAEFGMETIKAIPVGGAEDLGGIDAFAEAADLLLFDARPPKGADLTGGNGVAFDWSLLESYRGSTPFLLAGGLKPETVADAIVRLKRRPGFLGVDVSSGVEAAPGRKDPDKIAAFVANARAAFGPRED